MNRGIKITGVVVLGLGFLSLAFFIVMSLFVAGWMHTYRVFTRKTPIAQMEVDGLQQDELGPYTEVTLTFNQNQSALTSLLIRSESDTMEPLGEPQTYKLYGDEVALDGPVLKMKDQLLLLNTNNIYKVVRLRSEYSNPDFEDRRTEEMTRRYDLNGGIQSWRSLDETYRSNSPRGWFYRLFIDTSTIQSAGIFVTEDNETYTVYVTPTGFTFDKDN